ncbi:MAG: hypothetical protein NTV34_07910, partial [Proteobacteria bacterium]|nr:hypothetical protein [Pseudomonadota bacterium]
MVFRSVTIGSPPQATGSSYLVPGWWVRAWEKSSRHTDALNQLVDSKSIHVGGLFDLPMPKALSIWVLMLNQVHQKLLDQQDFQSRKVLFSTSEMGRLSGIDLGNEADQLMLDAAFKSFFGSRLWGRGAESLSAYPLFEGELQQSVQGDIAGYLVSVSSWTREVLIGVSDGHNDLMRAICGKPTASGVLGDSGPISLCYPAWLDFSDLERSVYLRMESLMQWDLPLLHIEGVFSVGIQDLFHGYAHGSFVDRLRILGGLGRKLVDHGIMVPEPEVSFYACDRAVNNAENPSLVWQASRDRRCCEEQRVFLGMAFESMRRCPDSEDILGLWQAMAPRAGSIGIDLDRLWRSIAEIPGGICSVGPNRVIQLHNLFFEWALRRPPLSDWPLPEFVRESEIYAICRLQGEIASDFRRFVDLALRDDASQKIIGIGTDISLACSSLSNSSEVYLRLSGTASRGLPGMAVKASDEKTGEIARTKVLPSIAEDLNDEILGPPNTRLLSLSDSKMLRIAHDELEKMMKMDQKTFLFLKSNYLRSLEDGQRALLLDFQRRMKPNLFDQQLKQRLVRFMVSN